MEETLTSIGTQFRSVTYTYDSRGFTGHEHYDFLHVINANARLYDPTIGRFFSPDPFVQAPDFTQGFNRYSYCMNNPVMYSDPNGEFFWAPVIVSAMVGAFFGGIRADQKGESFLGGMVKGAFIGGLGGGIDAALDGRDFLSGDVIIKNSRAYPTGPNYMQQPNSGDCAIKTGKAIYDYDNEIHISSSQIRQDLGLPCRGGVSDVDYWNAFGEQYGYDITQTSTLTENVPSPSTAYGIGSFNDGAHVALSNSQNGTDITHTVLIRETETRLHTTWGKGAHVKMSYRFWVQNPTTGYRDPIPYSSISKAVNMFIIRKQ